MVRNVDGKLHPQPAPYEALISALPETGDLELMSLDPREAALTRRVIVEVLGDVAKSCKRWNLQVELLECTDEPFSQLLDSHGKTYGPPKSGHCDDEKVQIDLLTP